MNIITKCYTQIRNRKIIGLPANWLKMHWIKLKMLELYVKQFKCDFNDNSKFNTINIKKSISGRTSSRLVLKNNPNDPKGKTETKERKRDVMNLLKFISPSKHDYYRNLRTNRHDGTSNACDKEDIIMLILSWFKPHYNNNYNSDGITTINFF
ncbi:hypothetical protein K0M31_012547 [Melipona bicolor]|uniref:Uncharacterized protein n=1 Tax=Melipona bicolor TaxID=60889 RepID=A0AA40FJS3_9HYME|nr:hypothetical protein K0M31_012547 [Melipona bicolor]